MRIPLFVAATLFLSLIAPAPAAAQDALGTFTSDAYGFRVSKPAEWSFQVVDNDPMAAWEARATAAAQGWPCTPLVVAGSIDCLAGPGFDLVLCNMIRTEFGPLLAPIRRLLVDGGSVLLSGILDTELDEVHAMLIEAGLSVVDDLALAEWVAIRAIRRGDR